MRLQRGNSGFIPELTEQRRILRLFPVGVTSNDIVLQRDKFCGGILYFHDRFVIIFANEVLLMEKKLFSIAEFAKFARITRQTLLFYDKIDLLSPVCRGENNYRLYSSGQLAVVNVIRTLQELGMTLSEIKRLKDHRAPASVKGVFASQIDMVDLKIEEWVRARKLLLGLTEIIDSVEGIDEAAVTVEHLQAEPIILGKLNDYSGGRNDYDALFDFYYDIDQRLPNLDLNYPVWGVFSEERIKRRDWRWPDRYYFYNPEGFDKRPSGLYAIGYARGNYGQTDGLYGRLLAYISENGYEISGPAYEEYPLNEICVSDENSYLIRVMVTVRKKKTLILDM